MHGEIGVAHSVISYNIGTPVLCFSVFRLYVCLQVCVSVFVGCVGGVGMHTLKSFVLHQPWPGPWKFTKKHHSWESCYNLNRSVNRKHR